MSFQLFDTVLSLRFLIPFTLVVFAFGPLIYSIRKSYLEGKKDIRSEKEHE